MKHMTLIVMICLSICMIAFAELSEQRAQKYREMYEESFKRVDSALDTAGKWKKVSEGWQSAAERFEAIAQDQSKTIQGLLEQVKGEAK